MGEEEGWKVEAKLKMCRAEVKEREEEEEQNMEQGGECICLCRGPWVTGLPPVGRLPTAKLLPSVATRCHKYTHSTHTSLRLSSG